MTDVPVTYRVVDAEGPKLLLKFKRGTDTAMMTVVWDGTTDIDEFLQRIFPPFPPPLPAVTVDTTQFIGKTGTLVPPQQPG